nr:hypothetical protein [Aeromicrobium sp.]
MSDRALKRAIAVVVVALVAVIAAGSIMGTRAVAGDLHDRSRSALTAAGLEDVAVEFHGREAALSGGNDVESRLATTLVAALPGVRRVEPVVVDDDPIPGVSRFELDRSGDDVEISGAVSSPDDAAAIKVAVATTLRIMVTGDVTVDRSVDEASWAAALPAVLEIVAGVRGLELEIPGDGTVRLGGEVDASGAHARVVRRVQDQLADLRLVDSLVVAPRAGI